jgi:hypothetical protein
LENSGETLVLRNFISTGKQAVTWLVENGYAASRAEAVALGNKLLKQNIFHHVLRDHNFKDEKVLLLFQKKKHYNV